MTTSNTGFWKRKGLNKLMLDRPRWDPAGNHTTKKKNHLGRLKVTAAAARIAPGDDTSQRVSMSSRASRNAPRYVDRSLKIAVGAMFSRASFVQSRVGMVDMRQAFRTRK